MYDLLCQTVQKYASTCTIDMYSMPHNYNIWYMCGILCTESFWQAFLNYLDGVDGSFVYFDKFKWIDAAFCIIGTELLAFQVFHLAISTTTTWQPHSLQQFAGQGYTSQLCQPSWNLSYKEQEVTESSAKVITTPTCTQLCTLYYF